MSQTRRLIPLLLTVLAAFALHSAAHAESTPKSSERSRQKQQAEQERAELSKKLGELRDSINKTEKARGSAADALAASEVAISQANRSLRELAAEQERTSQKLRWLAKGQEQLEAAVKLQRARLAKMLREQYVAGQDDRVRLLLSGDNPNRIARELRYLGYLSAEQTKAIEQLQQNLAEIEANKADAEETRAELDEIATEQREQKALLEKEKNKRKSLVGELSSKLSAQRKQAGNLLRDQERLTSLLDRLSTLIAQQRKAEEEESKRRLRAKAEARERTRIVERSRTEDKSGIAKADGRAESKADMKAESKTDTKAETARDSGLNSQPAQQARGSTTKNEPKELPDLPPPPDGAAFASQHGKLKLPVKGELLATFGAKRADGPNWKGVFIKAAEGAEVRSAGAGEVIFADWMRGFGNLIIVDHGGQYMSIYGNNQAVLKRPGDRVKAGDIIATVGNSGGNEQSGLYFEMRHQGRAIDPLTWMNR